MDTSGLASWWEGASSGKALHVMLILVGHGVLLGTGAACARNVSDSPVVYGVVVPTAVLAWLIGLALLYWDMISVSGVKALCLAGAISAGTLATIQALALHIRDSPLLKFLQPTSAVLSLLLMGVAWMFTYYEPVMRKIYGLTTGDGGNVAAAAGG